MTVKNNLINTKKAVSFLKIFRESGMMNVVAINPINNAITAITRPIGDKDIEAFINKHNGKNNLYFTVNEPKIKSPDDKLKKEHIDKIHAIWLDADPDKSKPFKEERIRLTALVDKLKAQPNPPTYIIDSGGGFQAFWVMDKPITATHKTVGYYEALNRGLANQHNTDTVHNIDRIMRIPYTLNIPNKKKKEAGRTPTPAKVYYAESVRGVRYA